MNKIFICANRHQSIPAKVSKFSILKRSEFQFSDVNIVYKENFKFMNALNGTTILRDGKEFVFSDDDMQNFTLLRFYIPELMNYQGKALIIDPDIFLVRHGIESIFDFDTTEFSLYCRKGKRNKTWSTSVMMTDNAKLKHWEINSLIDDMRNNRLDYKDLMSLSLEKSKIGSLSNIWNEFDAINEDTILLHTTEKITQPWRSGLYMNSSIQPLFGFLPRDKIYKWFGKDLRTGREHPKESVQKFFFDELKECINEKVVTIDEIKDAIKNEYIRKDIFNLLET